MQEHTLTDQFTTLKYDLTEDTRVVRDNWRTMWLLGGPKPTNLYWHHMLHPNIVFVVSDVFLLAQVYIPLAPDRTRIRFFGYQGTKRNPLAWITQRVANYIGRRMIREIQTEDAAIFEEVQKGIAHTQYKGCLGTREERIFAFQKYVRQAAPMG